MPTQMPATSEAVDARAWLAAALAAGPRPAAEIQAAAANAGITDKRLRTAREAVCIAPYQEARHWWWRLRDEQRSTAARARAWVADRVALGQLTAAEGTAARWLISVLADGPRRRDELETLAFDAFVADDPLSAAVGHLVIRRRTDLAMRAVEVWELREMPATDAREALALRFAEASAQGWPADPRRRGWIPPSGRRWVERLRAEHEQAVADFDAAQRALDERIAESVRVLAWRADGLNEGAAERALAAQVTEPEQNVRARQRLVQAVADARAALEDLARRQAGEEVETAALAGRMRRGLDLPDGWEPGDPVAFPELDRIGHRAARDEAREALRTAERALHEHKSRVEGRVAGLLVATQPGRNGATP